MTEHGIGGAGATVGDVVRAADGFACAVDAAGRPFGADDPFERRLAPHKPATLIGA